MAQDFSEAPSAIREAYEAMQAGDSLQAASALAEASNVTLTPGHVWGIIIVCGMYAAAAFMQRTSGLIKPFADAWADRVRRGGE